MPKKIIDENDSDSSTESEPEQYETVNEPVNEPKVKIIKLEKPRSGSKKQIETAPVEKSEIIAKPKRIVSEKQLEALRIARENRKKLRQPTKEAAEEGRLDSALGKPPASIDAAAVAEEAKPIKKTVNKPLTKLNKSELKVEADLLDIDISNLTNAQIIKKIREKSLSDFRNPQGGFDKSQEEFDTPEPKSPKKKITTKEKIIKEIHHHHYKDGETKKEVKQTKPVIETPKVKVKRETNIINFV